MYYEKSYKSYNWPMVHETCVNIPDGEWPLKKL